MDAGVFLESPIIALTQPELAQDGVRRAIRRLLAALDRAGVRYCHWKSNIRLQDSLAGKTDLDLLVDRRDAAAFQAVLLESGFRLTTRTNGGGHPGVFHAFAPDMQEGDLIHLHAYFQIVTGDSLVKNYRFPFEEVLLTGTRRLHGVPVPAPEAELVLFTLRIALKHTSLIEVLLVRRYYEGVPRELAWLRAAADQRGAEVLWQTWFPSAPVELFRELIDAIAEPSAMARRIRLGRRLARHLRGWRRHGPLASTASRSARFAELFLSRLRGRRGLIPVTSGLVIAFVGPKASGKSTLSNATAKWLGKHFEVQSVHVGKPPVTALSFLPRMMLPLARQLLPGERSSEYERPERREKQRYSLLHVMRSAIVAHDRRLLIRRAWLRAVAGAIILADRYPSAKFGTIDGSRFDDVALAECGPGFKRWLMRRERAAYAGLPRPDLVIRLVAPIETTIRRDAERVKDDGPDAAAVERRRRMETETEFPGCTVITIDTDRPLEETKKMVMQAVWEAI
jgi:thymidylate kinase